jgi:hypothetical protein
MTPNRRFSLFYLVRSVKELDNMKGICTVRVT